MVSVREDPNAGTGLDVSELYLQIGGTNRNTASKTKPKGNQNWE